MPSSPAAKPPASELEPTTTTDTAVSTPEKPAVSKPTAGRSATPPSQSRTVTGNEQLDQLKTLAFALNLANDDEWDGLSLIAKIARISGYVGLVEKKGYNAFHKYAFVREGDLVAAVRNYLAASDILIIPNAYQVTKEGDLTTVMVEYTVTSGDESFTFNMPGTGSDRGDKGVYKAITGSMKYALMKLFKIESGDDPEGDVRVDEREATATPAREVNVTSGNRAGVERGGHTTNASPVQIRRVNELMKDLQWERSDLVKAIASSVSKELILPEGEKEAGEAVLAFLRSLTTVEIGTLITDMADTYAQDQFEKDQGAGYG